MTEWVLRLMLFTCGAAFGVALTLLQIFLHETPRRNSDPPKRYAADRGEDEEQPSLVTHLDSATGRLNGKQRRNGGNGRFLNGGSDGLDFDSR